MSRRKAIYEALHPETKMGGSPGKPGGGKVAKTKMICSFADDTSAKTGVTPWTVRQEVQIAQKIIEPVRKTIVHPTHRVPP